MNTCDYTTLTNHSYKCNYNFCNLYISTGVILQYQILHFLHPQKVCFDK